MQLATTNIPDIRILHVILVSLIQGAPNKYNFIFMAFWVETIVAKMMQQTRGKYANYVNECQIKMANRLKA